MSDQNKEAGFQEINRSSRANKLSSGTIRPSAAVAMAGKGVANLNDKIKDLEAQLQAAMKQGRADIRIPGVNATFVYEDVPLNECVVWAHNARDWQNLSYEDVQDIYGSIKEGGIKMALLGRKNNDGKVELIDGSRRYFCAKLFEHETVPVYVGEISETEALDLTVVTNNNRKYTAFEIALFATAVMSNPESPFKTQEALAKHLGVTDRHLRNCMRILDVPKQIVDLFGTRKLLPVTFVAERLMPLLERFYIQHSDSDLTEALKNTASIKFAPDYKPSDKEINRLAAQCLKNIREFQKSKKPSTIKGKPGRSIEYKTKNGKPAFKATKLKGGGVKIETIQASDEQIEQLFEFAAKLFDIKLP